MLAQKVVINLFNDYSAIASEADCKAIHRKSCPSDLALYLKTLTHKEYFKDYQK